LHLDLYTSVSWAHVSIIYTRVRLGCVQIYGLAAPNTQGSAGVTGVTVLCRGQADSLAV